MKQNSTSRYRIRKDLTWYAGHAFPSEDQGDLFKNCEASTTQTGLLIMILIFDLEFGIAVASMAVMLTRETK